MDVDVGHHLRAPVRREQAVHQRLQAVGLVDDDLRVFGELTAGHFHGQQLRCTADAAQRVLDLVRQVAHQLLVGLRQAVRALFAVEADLLLDLDQLDQHTFGAIRSG